MDSILLNDNVKLYLVSEATICSDCPCGKLTVQIFFHYNYYLCTQDVKVVVLEYVVLLLCKNMAIPQRTHPTPQLFLMFLFPVFSSPIFIHLPIFCWEWHTLINICFCYFWFHHHINKTLNTLFLHRCMFLVLNTCNWLLTIVGIVNLYYWQSSLHEVYATP